jgi:hypothetical protein
MYHRAYGSGRRYAAFLEAGGGWIPYWLAWSDEGLSVCRGCRCYQVFVTPGKKSSSMICSYVQGHSSGKVFSGSLESCAASLRASL